MMMVMLGAGQIWAQLTITELESGGMTAPGTSDILIQNNIQTDAKQPPADS